MKHYVLTRYNFGWKPNTNICIKRVTSKGTVNSDIWLEDRKALFKRYYLPSMLAQTNKNFKIILSISSDTPPGYFDFLYEYQNIELSFEPFNEEFKLKLFNSCDDDQLITTRIDNDDAVSPDFIEKIQEIVRDNKQNLPVLVDTWGHKYSVKDRVFKEESYSLRHASAFCSVASQKKNKKWVYETSHTHMPEKFDRHIKIKERLYVQVIHNYNLGNWMFRKDDGYLDWFLRL